MSTEGKTKKVFIVEDDAVLKSAFTQMCESDGWQVVGFPDAQDLVKNVQKELPDVIVLDLILPNEDGMTVLKMLRDAHQSMPVIALSNLFGSDDLRDNLELLDATFINKSATSLEDVVKAMNRAIGI